jgi:twitching motility protein PilT
VIPASTYAELAAYMGTLPGVPPSALPLIIAAPPAFASSGDAGFESLGAQSQDGAAVQASEAGDAGEDDPSWAAFAEGMADGGELLLNEPEVAGAAAEPGPTRLVESVSADSTWQEILAFGRHHDVSDLHFSSGNPLLARRYGSLQSLTQDALKPSEVRRWLASALTREQLDAFDRDGDLEFVYTIGGWGRYRITAMKQRSGTDITARIIPSRVRAFEESGMPASCRELVQWSQGMVLVTGPVGCGKSSTLSTFIDMINQERRDHIITLENPIESVIEPKGCRISQRQIGLHSASQESALRAALREDPDIIVIAELRDMDTIRLAVSAAETGHLVFGTMNTANASRTIHRLIDSFPPEEQTVVRNMISESLRGVVSQQLLPRLGGTGMVAAYEVLLINAAVANMIRKEELHQLGTAMITGKSTGMVLLDDSLRQLVEQGAVDPREAQLRANSPKEFDRYLQRGGR